MFKTVLCSTLALVAGSAVVAMADAKDDVTAAATKLTDASSYSWKSASEAAGGGGGGGGRGGGGPVEGKTEKGGFTVLTMTRGDMTSQVVIKGDKYAMTNRDGEWQSSAEMAAAAAAQQADPNAGGGRRRGGRGGPGAQYANYKLPAETAADLASKTKSLASADGAIAGELNDDAAKAAFAFGGGRGGRRGGANGGNGGNGGGNGPQVANAKVTVKFWVKDGVLSKYEEHMTGTMSRGGNDVDIDRTTTVEISDVGSTKVEVPEGAKKKFE